MASGAMLSKRKKAPAKFQAKASSKPSWTKEKGHGLMFRTAARLMQGATPLLLLLHAAMVVSFFAYGRYEREPLQTALYA